MRHLSESTRPIQPSTGMLARARERRRWKARGYARGRRAGRCRAPVLRRRRSGRRVGTGRGARRDRRGSVPTTTSPTWTADRRARLGASCRERGGPTPRNRRAETVRRGSARSSRRPTRRWRCRRCRPRARGWRSRVPREPRRPTTARGGGERCGTRRAGGDRVPAAAARGRRSSAPSGSRPRCWPRPGAWRREPRFRRADARPRRGSRRTGFRPGSRAAPVLRRRGGVATPAQATREAPRVGPTPPNRNTITPLTRPTPVRKYDHAPEHPEGAEQEAEQSRSRTSTPPGVPRRRDSSASSAERRAKATVSAIREEDTAFGRQQVAVASREQQLAETELAQSGDGHAHAMRAGVAHQLLAGPHHVL